MREKRSLFKKIFKKKPAAFDTGAQWLQTLTAYQPVFTSWDGQIYENEIVRSAIDARARHISKLKFTMNGAAKPQLKAMLESAPNSWQTWGQFLYRVSTILDCQNTCFIVPVFNERLEISGYYPVLPTSCALVEYQNEIWLKYNFSNGLEGAVEFKLCVMLTKHQYQDEFFGTPNTALYETMNLINLESQGIEEAIKTSATYRFMAQVSNFSKSEDLKKERERFTENNLKGDGGGILLFPNTYKDVKQIETNPYTVNEAEMKEIRTNVYNYFGVNEDILQNKAYGDAWSAFYEGAVEVFAVQISDAMTKAIYTIRERNKGNGIVFTSNRLQYLSNKDKLNVSSQMADRGIMTRNEIREIWNLPPIDGGDVPTIRGEYYLLNGELKENEEYKLLHPEGDEDGTEE